MSKLNNTISHARLQDVLHYNPETGEFRWRKKQGRRKSGDVSGSVTGRGYCQITVDKTLYQAHRLAWFYMTGVWPRMFIDHINGIRTDNRFFNLREATRSQNNQNSRSSRGTSICRGVWKVRHNKWQAGIRINGKRHYLGHFGTEEEAAAAYKSAQRLFHPFAPDSNSI